MTSPTNNYQNLRSGTDYHVQQNKNNQPEQEHPMAALNIPHKIFDGTCANPKLWLQNFEALCTHKKVEDDARATLLPLYVDGKAQAWFYALPQATRTSYAALKTAFLQHWDTSTTQKWQLLDKYLSSKQNPEETVLDFVDRVSQLSTVLAKQDAADIILRGLQPHIRQHVLQQGSTSLEDVTSEAVKAEAMGMAESSTQFSSLQSQLTDIQQKLHQVMAVSTKSHQQPSNKQGFQRWKSQQHRQKSSQPASRTFEQCQSCGEYSHLRRNCKHRQAICHNCKIPGHLAKVCRKVRVRQNSNSQF